MTDALKAIIGASSRYLDWIERKPADDRTGAEIAADVIKRVGLVVKKPPDYETHVAELLST